MTISAAAAKRPSIKNVLNFKKSYLILLAIAALALASSSHAAQNCDAPESPTETRTCLGIDLLDSDLRINRVYTQLIKDKAPQVATVLRDEQRQWLKRRATVCSLESREPGRQKWIDAILRDNLKTLCVVRITRSRIVELEKMLPAIAASKPVVIPGAIRQIKQLALDQHIDFEQRKSTTRSTGKRYFEVALNFHEIAEIDATVLIVGVKNDQQLIGAIRNIRLRDKVKAPMRIGVAADLDNGKLYLSSNGAWEDGEPGSNLGQELKLGRDYSAIITISSEKQSEMLMAKAYVPNFGDYPFAYSLPSGYSAWRTSAEKK